MIFKSDNIINQVNLKVSQYTIRVSTYNFSLITIATIFQLTLILVTELKTMIQFLTIIIKLKIILHLLKITHDIRYILRKRI